MRDYIILTDSSCDLPAPLAEKLGLVVIPLSVQMEGKQYTNYLDGREITPEDFYALLREGKTGSTSAANIAQFTAYMEPLIQKDMDILYLGFSSSLSTTYNASMIAAKELGEKYPEARIYTVDTLCASLGQGLLVYLAALQKQNGKTIEEVRDYVENTKLHVCHWFTVNDLNHLKRGGRLSSTSAFVGTVLHIKPVLHVDNEGRLINVEKTQGRKASIRKLVEHMKETAVSPIDQTVFISHGNCEEEAKFLAELVCEQIGVKPVLIHWIGPVIGAHSGPGTLALFYLGEKR